MDAASPSSGRRFGFHANRAAKYARGRASLGTCPNRNCTGLLGWLGMEGGVALSEFGLPGPSKGGPLKHTTLVFEAIRRRMLTLMLALIGNRLTVGEKIALLTI